MAAAAGWYPDPTGRFEFRYFDGETWSAEVSRAGRQFVDPPSGHAPRQPQAPWQQPQAPWQQAVVAPRQEGNGLAVTSLVLGVLACVFGLIPFLFLLVFLLALLAIIFGAIGASRRSDGTRSKMAIAGLVLGLIGVTAGVLGVMIIKVWVDETTKSLNEIFSTVTFEDATETTELTEGEAADSQPVDVLGDPLEPYDSSGDDPAVGEIAPVITGASFTGEPITLNGRQAGPVMVVFLAHWCPHCNTEIPRLLEWKASGAVPAQLQVIGVSTAVAASAVNYPPAQWLADKGWSWPVMADQSNGEGVAGVAAQALGVSGFPFFVILGSDNQVLARSSGEMEIDELERLVEGALANDAGTLPLQKPDVMLPAELPVELQVTSLIAGTDSLAEAGDTLEVHYLGYLSGSGEEFDNSYDSGAPLVVTLGQGMVIDGWDQGLIGVQVGGRYQIDIPADMAYGDSGEDGRPAGPLTFIVDIIAITPA